MHLSLLRTAVIAATTLPVGLLGQTASPSVVGADPAPGQRPSNIARIEQTQLSRSYTARDLIGKNVVNHDGERLGTINDVLLSPDWAQRFGAGETPAGDATAAPASESKPLVYVSTGGVLGVGGRLGLGADWVAVPADELIYDRTGDRFILNLPAARFTSIAQGRPRSEVAQENRTAQTSSGGIGSSGSNQAHSAEVQRVQEALRKDSQLSGADRIRVSHTGDAIELNGEVAEVRQIRRAGDVAREHTELEVRNQLETAQRAAE